MSALDYVRLARPKDWTKNVFVLMPMPFALAAGGTLDVPSFLLGVGGFSLVTSAVYAVNDAIDAERDRAHEKKRTRPVAAGRISPGAAFAFAFALLCAGAGPPPFPGAPPPPSWFAGTAPKRPFFRAARKHWRQFAWSCVCWGFWLAFVL